MQRKSGVWDSKKGKGVWMYERVTNYFFMEFPETHGAKEMFEVFKEYELIDEAVIPPKRDIRGEEIQLR